MWLLLLAMLLGLPPLPTNTSILRLRFSQCFQKLTPLLPGSSVLSCWHSLAGSALALLTPANPRGPGFSIVLPARDTRSSFAGRESCLPSTTQSPGPFLKDRFLLPPCPTITVTPPGPSSCSPGTCTDTTGLLSFPSWLQGACTVSAGALSGL